MDGSSGQPRRRAHECLLGAMRDAVRLPERRALTDVRPRRASHARPSTAARAEQLSRRESGQSHQPDVLHGCRIQQAPNRVPTSQQLRKSDHGGDEQAGEVLSAAKSVGVALGGCLASEDEGIHSGTAVRASEKLWICRPPVGLTGGLRSMVEGSLVRGMLGVLECVHDEATDVIIRCPVQHLIPIT